MDAALETRYHRAFGMGALTQRPSKVSYEPSNTLCVHNVIIIVS